MKGIRITAILIAALLMLFSIGSIVMYFVIVHFAPEKDVSITVNTGQLANVTDEDENFIIYVEYWSNHNNTGYEALEVKLNYYMSDQEMRAENPAIYSKGVQIIGSEEGSIQFNSVNVNFTSGLFNTETKNYHTFKTDGKTYYYDSQNGFSFKSINKIDENCKFEISIGSNENAENYLMKLLGKDGQVLQHSTFLGAWHSYTYNDYDLNYLLAALLGACKTNNIGYGADGKAPLELSNIFTYKKMENGSYTGDWLKSDELVGGKLKENFTNYFTVRIKTHENGITKAEDSMFGMVEGKQDFEVLSGALQNDYFHNEQVITLTEADFDYYGTNYCSLIFRDEVVNNILNNYSNRRVDIIINDKVLRDNGILVDTNYSGFFKNDAFDRIKPYIDTVTIKHTQSSTGEITYWEVTQWKNR